MRRRVPLLICVLLLAAILGGVTPAGAQASLEETHLEAQLQDDGDARWTITATIPLENDRQVRNFRSFADSFENGERDFELGVDTFRRAAQEASTASGRDMAVVSERRDSRIVNETDGDEVTRYGELQVSFTWESFGRVDENGTMHVDDAFNTTSGTWFNTLDEGETLVIRSPPGYGAPSTAPIGAQEGDLQWEGPRTFEPGYFEIVYPPSNAFLPDWDVSTMLLAGAVLMSSAALLLGGFLLWRREGSADDGAGDAPAAAAEETGGGGGNPAPADGGAAAAGADDGQDLELLSDEERVEYLLERNGGRMKQANIVKETGWSNAKVSQLLSSMEDDERIDKLRIGRENLISLPGENVGDLAAGHDEE